MASTDPSKWTWPNEGGVAECLSKPLENGLLYVEAFVEPGYWYASITMNGKQVGLYHKIISKDGKTMKQTYTGFDGEGRPIKIIKVLEKQ